MTVKAPTAQSLAETLEELFRHDALARAAERALLGAPDRRGLKQALKAATEQATAELAAEPDAGAAEGAEQRLEALADLWGQLGGETAAQVLVGLLASPSPSVRHAASEALIEVAEPDNGDEAIFGKVAGLLRASLRSGALRGPALAELAYLVAELHAPEMTDLLLDMLGHDDPAVVAAALEVAGEWGWHGGVAAALERLSKDPRTVTVDDEDEGGGSVSLSLGEIAQAVTETLRSLKGGAGENRP
jgi:hypothetical protein